MPLLVATNIRHAYGEKVILDGVSLSVEPGERVGIVGRNGCGKSTLMKIMTSQIGPDSGTISLQRGSSAGYLHQDPNLDPGETLLEAAEGAFADLHRVHHDLNVAYEKMAEASAAGDDAEVERLLKQQARLEEEMERLGGYAVEHKIGAVLHGLGFTDAQFGLKVAKLSGGQKGRLALARLLLTEPDILLLDEPTNHLDIDGRLWLESFLKDTFRGAVVMVSHDRYLLDNVVTRIIEVEQHRLIEYPGNYAAFRETRALRRLTQMRAHEKQQDRFKKEMAFVLKYKAGQRAKEARGRLTKLEREKEQSTLERPVELEAFRLKLPKAERTSDVNIAARGISKSYTREDGSEKVLFREFDATVNRAERWAVIGPNGAGKTTLVRCLLGDLVPDSGTVKLGTNLKIGYYRQTHEHLDPEDTVITHLQRAVKRETGVTFGEQEARNLAGAFLFSGDEQERRLGTLSGGERSRAALAALLASAKNLLVLDEPTNHLDIPSAERLEEALALPDEDVEGYEGTLILISHDRALIDATCDHLIVLDGGGGAEIFHGTYTEWHEKQAARSKESQRAEAQERERREEAERKRRAAEEAKKRDAARKSGPSTNALARLKTEQLEEKIEKIETRIKQIDQELGDPEVWQDARKSGRLGEERGRLAAELEPLEFEWARRAGEQ